MSWPQELCYDYELMKKQIKDLELNSIAMEDKINELGFKINDLILKLQIKEGNQ